MSAEETKSAQGWSNAKLSDLLTVLRGVTYKKERAAKEPMVGLLPILRANNIQDGLVFEDLVYVPEDCVSETQMLRSGDIIIAASSGSRHIVGKAAQLKTDWRGSFGTFCFGLRPKPGVNPSYLSWFLQTSEYRHQVSELSAGVNINNLRATHIEEIPIAVAPPDEQRRIVAEIEKQFTRLEAGVAALRRVQANLKRYRAAVLKAACEGRLVPTEAELHRKLKTKNSKLETGEQLLARILTERRQNWQGRGEYKEPAAPDTTELTPLPEGWVWTNIEQLRVFSLYGPRFSSDDYAEDGYIVLRTTDISESGKVDATKAPRLRLSKDEFERYRAKRGDLLVTRTGSLGTLAIFDDDAEAIPGAYLIQFRLATEPVTTRYLFLFLKSSNGQCYLTGKGAGVGRPNLNAPTIEALPVPLPPLAEQTRIVAEVERRLSVVEELSALATAKRNNEKPLNGMRPSSATTAPRLGRTRRRRELDHAVAFWHI